MNGPTIQQIKAQNVESLWSFLAALPGSLEAQVFYALVVSGIIGMAAHYFMRWVTNEITGSLLKYMFRDYPKRTLLALTTAIGAALAAITTGVFETPTGEFVGWLTVLWLGLTTGYASDSIANKGKSQPSGEEKSADSTPSAVTEHGTLKLAPMLLALVLGAALALGAPNARAQQTIGGTIIASAAQTAATVNSADLTNSQWRGAHVIINVSAWTAGTYTPHIQGKDPASGAYYDILVGTAIGATGTTVLKVYPGIATAANGAASDLLPRTWRVSLVGAAGQSMTLSVGIFLEQ